MRHADSPGRTKLDNAFEMRSVMADGRPHRQVGPDSYSMALPLRRANAVKDALVRDGVPATAISVVGTRAAEPPRRDRDPVSDDQSNQKGGLTGRLFLSRVFHVDGPPGSAAAMP